MAIASNSSIHTIISHVNNGSIIDCRYRSEYMGVFGYADDLSLLCPSFSGMKEMLSICEQYAHDNNIMFNASKSQLIYFGKIKIRHIL